MDCSPINLRKIAILVSSIDACAAEQLLAEFPPDVAQHIRQAASDLDDVTSYQRQEILVEFQHEVAGVSCAPSGTGEDYQEPSACDLPTPEKNPKSRWSVLPAEAIVPVVASEAPMLVAVLVSEMDAYGASELLSKLPSEQSCEVLRALKNLHELDGEQLQNIEGRLASIFSEAEVRSRRGQQYGRQLSALVEAAPEELQQVWRTAIADPLNQSGTELERLEGNLFDQFDASHRAFQASQNSVTEFEYLLELPRGLLSELFSTTAPETVLLGLAGASTDFMDRFTSMLVREDADALQERMLQLGALQISDIDQAQSYLLQHAQLLISRVQAA